MTAAAAAKDKDPLDDIVGMTYTKPLIIICTPPHYI
jgi:hypothetical protein